MPPKHSNCHIWEVLNGVGVDGVGVIFPFFYAFFPFFHAFLRFSSLFSSSPRGKQQQFTAKMGNFTPTPSAPTPGKTSRHMFKTIRSHRVVETGGQLHAQKKEIIHPTQKRLKETLWFFFAKTLKVTNKWLFEPQEPLLSHFGGQINSVHTRCIVKTGGFTRGRL